jgi:hypothetical protein
MPAAWVTFRRRDPSAIVRMVRDLAVAGDAGAYGHGVELIVESPRLRWWRRLFDRVERDQARIAVTGPGGATGYPMHVRLVTGFGADAAGKIDRRDNWATSVTSMRLVSAPATAAPPHPHEVGEAIIMLKRGPDQATGPVFDPAEAAREVVDGTVAALADLHPFSPDRGWRSRVERSVLRT